MHDRERQTTIDALSIDDDRAGAALPLVAALLRAGQPEMLAQRIEQSGARVEIEGIAPSINREAYLLARRHRSFRRRLGQRRWSSECQRRDPGCLEEKPPRCQMLEAEPIVHNTVSALVQTGGDVAISRGHGLRILDVIGSVLRDFRRGAATLIVRRAVLTK